MNHMLKLLILWAALVTATSPAHAQFPDKPIRLIVPYSAGGATDSLARLIATALAPRMGQPVIVENKPGAGTMLASQFVANAPPDGYTLLINGSSLTIAVAVYTKVSVDPRKDLTPVNMLVAAPHILVVHPSVTAKDVAELVDLAKAKPGTFTYASVGVGTTNHLEGELLKSMGGVDILHIPYKGSSPALQDLLAGRVNMMFDAIGSSLPHIQSGKLRALGVSPARRSLALPDVPTVAEAGLPGFDAMPWLGLFAPPKTPAAVVARVNTEVSAVLADPEMKKKLLAIGLEVVGEGPEPFTRFIQDESRKWAGVAKAANIKLEAE